MEKDRAHGLFCPCRCGWLVCANREGGPHALSVGPLSCTPSLARLFSPGMGTEGRLPLWHHLPTQLLPLVVDADSAGFVSKGFPGCGAGLPDGLAVPSVASVWSCSLCSLWPLGRRPGPGTAHTALFPSTVLGGNTHSCVCGLLLQSWCLHFVQQGLSYTHSLVTLDRTGQDYFRDADTAAGTGEVVSEDSWELAPGWPSRDRQRLGAGTLSVRAPTFTPALVPRTLNPLPAPSSASRARGEQGTPKPWFSAKSLGGDCPSVFSNCLGLRIPARCPLFTQASALPSSEMGSEAHCGTKTMAPSAQLTETRGEEVPQPVGLECA